jgi:hypothetical protein
MKLTLHDQALINLCGWVACTRWPDLNRDMMLAQIRRLVPQVNHANPLIEPLARAASAVVTLAARPVQTGLAEARLELDAALAAIFMARGAAACAQLWPDENSQPEPAPAAEPGTASEPARAP